MAQKKVATTVYLDADQFRLLQVLARKHRVVRAVVIRRGVTLALEEMEPGKPLFQDPPRVRETAEFYQRRFEALALRFRDAVDQFAIELAEAQADQASEENES